MKFILLCFLVLSQFVWANSSISGIGTAEFKKSGRFTDLEIKGVQWHAEQMALEDCKRYGATSCVIDSESLVSVCNLRTGFSFVCSVSINANPAPESN